MTRFCTLSSHIRLSLLERVAHRLCLCRSLPPPSSPSILLSFGFGFKVLRSRNELSPHAPYSERKRRRVAHSHHILLHHAAQKAFYSFAQGSSLSLQLLRSRQERWIQPRFLSRDTHQLSYRINRFAVKERLSSSNFKVLCLLLLLQSTLCNSNQSRPHDH